MFLETAIYPYLNVLNLISRRSKFALEINYITVCSSLSSVDLLSSLLLFFLFIFFYTLEKTNHRYINMSLIHSSSYSVFFTWLLLFRFLTVCHFLYVCVRVGVCECWLLFCHHWRTIFVFDWNFSGVELFFFIKF